MSRTQQKPVLHGRDHLPGHPDPIPGLSTGTGSFSGTVLATTDLLAYWRLGETGSPWADTSGVAPAADMTEQGSGTALTPDVPGGLPAGDDGALELNYDGVSSVGGRYAQAATGGGAKDFALAEMTVCAWVNVKASATSRRGVIVGNSTILAGPGSKIGWGLQVVYPARTVRFTRGDHSSVELYAETPAGVVAGDWNFFVGTYDGATISLYANGVLLDTTADPSGTVASGDVGIRVGFGYGESVAFSAVPSWFYGTADEVGVWTRALTQDEIDALYLSGLAGSPDGSQVLISDGHGGFHWGQANGDAIADESIVNRHVADGADIDVLKLAHPGGTTDFLRADGTWAVGPGGATGPAGPTGPQGPPGFSQAGYSDLWSWTTSTSSAATSGQIGLNAGTWAAATQINLNEQTKDGRNLSTLAFPRFAVGDQLYVQHKTDPTRYAYYTISGTPTDHGTWWSWPVTVGLYGGAVPGGTTDTNLTWLVESGFVPTNPADDDQVWMPLFDDDGSLVLDADGGLIPTLIDI